MASSSDGGEPSGKTNPTGKFTDFSDSVSTFAMVMEKQTYIDKSLFIKEVLGDERFHLITAPRRFGKTTTLDMLQCYVEIEVDPEHGPRQEEAKKNVALFDKKLYNGEDLKIKKEVDDDFRTKHLGQYPVISVSFKCDSVIDTYDSATSRCKKIVEAAYLKHTYLYKSEMLKKMLTVNRWRSFKKWYEDIDSLTFEEVTDGLKDLCEYLKMYYNGKKVIILVDECDSVIMKALFGVQGNQELLVEIEKALLTAEGKKDQIRCNQLRNRLLTMQGEVLTKIVELSNGILSAALKDRTDFVEKAIITGISHIAGVGISGMNNVTSDPFLQNVQFLDYYGLTEEEVKDLLGRFAQKGNKITFEKLKKQYNGYVSKSGKPVYPLWSVMKCLDLQEVDEYFEGTGTIEKLAGAFQIPSIRTKIQQLVLGAEVSIQFKKKLSTDDLRKLRSQFAYPELRKSLLADVFLSFLFEQGYLTYGGNVTTRNVTVKIPNEELKEIFIGKLTEYYNDFCKFKDGLRDNCIAAFDGMITAITGQGVKTDFQRSVEIIRANLQELIRDAISSESCLKLNEAALHTSVCFVFFQSEYKYVTEYILKSHLRLDLGVVKEKCGFIIEFKYDDGNQSCDKTAKAALAQIDWNKYAELFEVRKFFPVSPKHIVKMGISINNNKDVSIACQIEGEDNIFYSPEPQPELQQKRRGSRCGRGRKRARSH